MNTPFGVALLFLGVLHAGVTTTSLGPLRFVSITAGADHVCALTDDGDAYCWGSNTVGQLGNGAADSIPHTKPSRVHSEAKFTELSAGFMHTCALERNGSAWCWGANETAQLGDGTTKNAPTPTPIRFV
jgi:alpha-tubulin suppressor-like RCC1 family protein